MVVTLDAFAQRSLLNDPTFQRDYRLDQQAHPGEVILADWDVSNYVAPRTPAHVVGGHPVATLDAKDKKMRIETVFAHTASRHSVGTSSPVI